MRKIHYTDQYLLNPYHPVTVFVIGAGGTGSQVVTCLARMGMALQALGHPGLHVTVFDPDTVTGANIGRQLFSEAETGLNKAVALVTRINRFFGYTWEAKGKSFPSRRKHDDDSPGLANIIITCTDNIRSRLDLWRLLKHHRKNTHNDEKTPIYWMDFGNAPDNRAGSDRQYPEQDTSARLHRVPHHTQNECDYRGDKLFHH